MADITAVPEKVTMLTRVCMPCLELNLIKHIDTQVCKQCLALYCEHAASKIDPQYCMHCLSDVQITETVEHRVITKIDDKSGDIIRQHDSARRISCGGLDFLFHQRKISKLSDDELDMSIEYHKAIMSNMLYEREARRVQKAHRNAGVNIVLPSTGTTAVKIKKPKAVKQTKSQQQKDLELVLAALPKDQADAMRQMLKDQKIL